MNVCKCMETARNVFVVLYIQSLQVVYLSIYVMQSIYTSSLLRLVLEVCLHIYIYEQEDEEEYDNDST
jgi:hypothetical protein